MSPLIFFCAIFITVAGIVEATVIRLEVVVSQTVVLPCTLDGTNGTQAFWFSTELGEYLTYLRAVKRTVPEDMASRLAVTGQGTNYDLRISHVSTSDAGNFRCSIYTTTATVNRKLMHVVNVDYQLVVNVPPGPEYPLCDVHSNGGTRSVGDFVTLSCASHGGRPPAQLAWYRGDQPISVITTRYVTGDVITFNKTLDEYDNGVTYVCESRSPAYSQPMMCSITPLSVPPIVTMETLHDRVYEKDPVNYSCRGTGIPSVSYRWLMNGTEVAGYSQRIVVGRDGSELQILGADPVDNGTTITCEVSTPAGLTSSYTRTVIVMSRPAVTCNQGNDEGNNSVFTGQSKLAILPLLVAFLGGVGLTLLVVLAVVFECKRRNKQLVIKTKQKTLGSRFWTTKNEGITPPTDPLPGINIFVKESIYDTNDQSNQPPSLPPRGPTGMSQKNQYFDMNSGTFQKHLLSATLPAVGSKNDYQMRCITHTPPLGYENVEKGSTTDVSELTQDDMCDSYRPPIPTPDGRPPMSPIYMEPKTHEEPQQQVPVEDAADVALRRGYDAVPPGKRRNQVRATRNHRRRDEWERPEYTEIDGLAPVRNTYETSIISNFEL